MHNVEAAASDPQREQKRAVDSPPPPRSRPAKVPRTAVERLEKKEEEGEADPESMRAVPGAQRYLVAVEYLGTKFFGAQKQPNCRTVVGVLEGAFQEFVGQPVAIFCSSRTDAGVHALSNVCHVDVVRTSKRKPGEVLPPHEPGVVKRAVNHFLQKNEGDAMVIDVRCVPADFHARFRAQERTYFYRILSGPEPLSVFDRERAWHVLEELDVDAMQKACQVLVGCHDFSSFRAAGCQLEHFLEYSFDGEFMTLSDGQAKSPVKTLDELHVSEVMPSPYFPSCNERAQIAPLEESFVHEIESDTPQSCNDTQDDLIECSQTSREHFGQRKQHRCYLITARARSFLYHQVRLMVGVLKTVGAGDMTVNDVERILNAKTITASGPMAPACGLYLGNVKYDLP